MVVVGGVWATCEGYGKAIQCKQCSETFWLFACVNSDLCWALKDNFKHLGEVLAEMMRGCSL